MPRRNRRDRSGRPAPVGPDTTRRDHRERACRDKVPYGTEAAARLVADELEERHGGSYSAYRCPQCGRWHTGRS